MTEILSVHNLTMKFGGLVAVDDLSFAVAANSITSIIGPNGAGKTTVFNCITGFYHPTSGSILAHSGHRPIEVTTLPGHKIVRKAQIARTFQNIRLFGAMTVFENLLVAQHNALMHASHFCIKGLFGFASYRKEEKTAVDRAKHWLDRVGLWDVADHTAHSLPYGAQRRLEIARAMCVQPKIICLDEPAAGLNPKETESLNQLLLDVRREFHTTVLLIEHDMRVVMQISDHVVVLDYGRKICEGSPAQVQCDANVIKAYLGEDHA